MEKNESGIAKMGEKENDKKERNISLGRRIEDGLLVVVYTKIYGHTVKALIDSRLQGVLSLQPACQFVD